MNNFKIVKTSACIERCMIFRRCFYACAHVEGSRNGERIIRTNTYASIVTRVSSDNRCISNDIAGASALRDARSNACNGFVLHSAVFPKKRAVLAAFRRILLVVST